MRKNARRTSKPVSRWRMRHMTLAQRLDHFDPKRHGGEVMATPRRGAEVM